MLGKHGTASSAISVLIFVGHDTTACTLVWALHLLANHEEQQEHLRRELLERAYSRHDLTFDDLEELPFLDGFVREVLRLYCPGMNYGLE